MTGYLLSILKPSARCSVHVCRQGFLLIVIEGLQADDFYDPRHRTAFEVMASMAEQNNAVDSLTFREEIKKLGLEERLGGLPFVARTYGCSHNDSKYRIFM